MASSIGFTSSDSSNRINRNINDALNKRSESFNKLSSGLRINKASDDAAGLAIAADLEASIATLGTAGRNVSDFSSALEIADGAVSQIQDYSTKLAELATQASNGTLSDAQRSTIQQQYSQYSQEIQRIVDTTEFNGTKLLQGNSATAQVGNGSDANSQLQVNTGDFASYAASLSSVDISTAAGARSALDTISNISQTISARRGDIGASQSRLDSISSTLSSRSVSESEARSRITDADIADEAARATRYSILADASTALAAQTGKLDANRIKALLG